ncbi:MAG: 3-phosphoshikimate 1-carboxyvinyltransferase [Verrucomicrobia bacterium]|nr:3-phosphoshikimate 1-carboxyvinyltransferase [Verrucomicrobiota bacterium]
MSPIESRTVHPGATISGELQVPGDKSISHRVAMLGGIASGESSIGGFLASEDCLNTLRAMRVLGAEVDISENGSVNIRGVADNPSSPSAPVNLGNSGTGMRLLTGLLSGYAVTAELTGDASLCSRPMGRIRDPLQQMGARIDLTRDGTAPLIIHGGSLHAISYALPVASAQVKSAVLLAGLHAKGETVVVEPVETRDHTERLLLNLGVELEIDGLTIRLKGCGEDGLRINGGDWFVPGDISSAAFWITAAAAREGNKLVVRNVGLNPRRTAIIDVLRRMGADIEVLAREGGNVFEPYGDVTVRGSALRGTEVGGKEIPNLIDELPLVAVAAALAEGETVIRDAAELRVKESDRITCMVKNLRVLGVDVEERPDGMVVRGPARLLGGSVRSFGDHRVAMALTVLALFGSEKVRVEDVECIQTSYPRFWTDLERVGGSVEGR